MSDMSTGRPRMVRGLALLLLATLLGGSLFIWQDDVQFPGEALKWRAEAVLFGSSLAMALLLLWASGGQRDSPLRQRWLQRRQARDENVEQQKQLLAARAWHPALQRHLAAQHSWWQRRRKLWLLVAGDEALVRVHFPWLIEQGWLDARQAVLVWSGATPPDGGWARLRGRWRQPAAVPRRRQPTPPAQLSRLPIPWQTAPSQAQWA